VTLNCPLTLELLLTVLLKAFSLFCLYGLQRLAKNVLAWTAKRLAIVNLAAPTLDSLPRERETATGLVPLGTCLCLVTPKHITRCIFFLIFLGNPEF
jgi:hypothetical protein